MDNAYFTWSVVVALYPAERHVDWESSYSHYTTVLNLADIEFLMILKDIPKFENLNNISMNMYNIEDKQVLLLRLINDKRDKHVNLLYLPDSHNGSIKHFAWIKNLFLCLHYFSSCEKLQSHEVDCQKINNCAIRLPSEDDRWLEFGNCITTGNECRSSSTSIWSAILRKTEFDKEDASSYAYQQHEAFSIGYYVQYTYDDTLSSYHFRRDEDCTAWFAQQLNDLAHRVKNIISAYGNVV